MIDGVGEPAGLCENECCMPLDEKQRLPYRRPGLPTSNVQVTRDGCAELG
jgi:hypothetical protein